MKFREALKAYEFHHSGVTVLDKLRYATWYCGKRIANQWESEMIRIGCFLRELFNGRD